MKLKHFTHVLGILGQLILLVGGCSSVVSTSDPNASVTATSSFIVFSKTPYDFILPDATFSPGEIVTQGIGASASPNEYTGLSVAIKAGQASLSNVIILSTDLVGSGSVISRSNIDIRVVKVWKQKNNNPEGGLTPELLLYNDADVLSAPPNTSNIITPPTISTVLNTNIPSQTSKQFWITIDVPSGTPAGDYHADLTIKTDQEADRSVQLSLTVLPIALHEPTQKYMIYYYYPSYDSSDPVVQQNFLLKELTDIKQHGFTGILAQRVDPQPFFQTMKDVGLNGPVILRAQTDPIPTLENYGYTPYVYGIDEPYIFNAPTDHQSVRHQIRASYDIHSAGGKVVTAITDKQISDMLNDPNSAVYDQIDPVTNKTFRAEGITHESLDWVNYNITNPFSVPTTLKSFVKSLITPEDPLRMYIANLRIGGNKQPIVETYYWQCWHERPLINRQLAGYFLWTSKLDGIMPFTYMMAPNNNLAGDPFNDFDSVPGNPNGDMMTVYPSAQGPIPTTEWEALRAGYNDMRYLTTLFDLLNDLEKTHPDVARSIENEIDQNLKQYYMPDMSGNSLWKPSALDFENTRSLIISKILLIQNIPLR